MKQPTHEHNGTLHKQNMKFVYRNQEHQLDHPFNCLLLVPITGQIKTNCQAITILISHIHLVV